MITHHMVDFEIIVKEMKIPHIEYFKNRTIRAKGKLLKGKRDGYWKWYRKDGSKMKTGYFKEGKLAKEWMRYDKNGKLIRKD